MPVLKPLPHQNLRPKRLPWARRMTIAIGLLAQDGVILAADTEESIPDYLKRHQGKIMTTEASISTGIGTIVDYSKGIMAISGAGDGDYLDSISQDMCAVFMRSQKKHLLETKTELQNEMKNFYRDHVIPFTALPSEERPELALIMAIVRSSERAVWTTRMNRIKRCFGFGAVGIGAFYALTMLTRLYKELDVDTAKILAAYTMFYVKDHVPGCGKETQIVCLQETSCIRSTLKETREMEGLFADYTVTENEIFHSLIAPEETDARQLSSKLRSLRKRFRRLASKTS